jgi:hypothetical protein
MVRDTFVVVASDRDLGLEQGPLEGVRGADAWVYGEADVDAVIERAGRRVLTDDDAPVEVLLAPVLEVRQR